VAAAYLFQSRFGAKSVLPDDAFLRLVGTVVPSGYGLVGLILAGLTAATFSSIDSMMNSVTTLLTMDVYQKYVRPQASEKEMVRFGRLAIVGMVMVSAWLAWLTYNPNSSDNFFLRVSAQGSYLTPGIVVAFFLGMVWRKANAAAAVITMLVTPFFSIGIEKLYTAYISHAPALQAVFGAQLNFMHRVFLTLLFCTALHISLSLLLNRKKTVALQSVLSIQPPISFLRFTALVLALQIPCILLFRWQWLSPLTVATLAAFATLACFIYRMRLLSFSSFFRDDRLYAGLLSAVTVWLLYVFA